MRGNRQGADNGKVMAGDGAEELDMGNAHVSEGACGETMQGRYAGTEMGDAEVGG